MKPTSDTRADPDTLHRVYSELLSICTLSEEHQTTLGRRSDRLSYFELGYRTLPQRRATLVRQIRQRITDDVLLSVPGFIVRKGRSQTPYVTISGVSGLLIPVRDPQERIVGLKIRVDDASNNGKYRWLSSKSAGGPSPSTPAHCPLKVRGPIDVVRMTEGPLKADIANALNCCPTIGADSVANWRPAVELATTLSTRAVRLAFDADFRSNAHVAASLVRCVAAVRDSGLQVEVETWSAEYKGIDDLLAAGLTPNLVIGDAVDALISGLSPNIMIVDDSQVRIEVTPDEHEVNDAAVAALSHDEGIYQRAGQLVRIVGTDDAEKGIQRSVRTPRIVPLPVASIRERLTRHARFVRSQESEDGLIEKHVHPPSWCIQAVAGRIEWRGIRSLLAVIHTPILRQDGTLLSTVGFDATTGLYFQPSEIRVDVPTGPVQEDAIRAAELLLDVVSEFPLDKPEHRSAWLAFVLTPLARYAFSGPAPMFLFDANVRGSGKTLLAEIGALITTGRDFARMSNPSCDDEARKRITAIGLSGDPLVLIDNVEGTLGSPALNAALTGTVWQDRILQQSRMVDVPLTAVWAASGNNVILAADTTRRVCHIRLNSPLEHPELREGFRRPDLRKWVQQQRSVLLSAALTILRAYCVAGRPSQRVKPWGSFEGWSALVREAIVWCGLADPGAARSELMVHADREAAALRDLIGGFKELDSDGNGLTAAEMLTLLEMRPMDFPLFRAALIELCNTAAGRLPTAKSIGNRLRHLRGRVIGAVALDSRMNRDGVAKWMVVSVGGSDAGSAASAGSSREDSARGVTKQYGILSPGPSEASPRDPADPADPAPMVHCACDHSQDRASGGDLQRGHFNNECGGPPAGLEAQHV